jgi:hypothetical protein
MAEFHFNYKVWIANSNFDLEPDMKFFILEVLRVFIITIIFIVFNQ